MEERVGEEKAKMSRKQTEIFIGGRMSTPKDVIAMVKNILAWGMTMTAEFESSLLWHWLYQYVHLMQEHQDEGTHWQEGFLGQPQQGLNMFNDIQLIWGTLYSIALDHRFQTADVIAPGVYFDAGLRCHDIVANFK